LKRQRERKVPSSDKIRDQIERKAKLRCEYCRAPQAICGYQFHLEHIHLRSRKGSDSLSNRALACASCNLAKGGRIRGIDPATGREVHLFHPRNQRWNRHFRWTADQGTLVGITAAGKATIAVLDLNSERRSEARRHWFETGWLP
jgi:5-methylcytosine-specific restriction endonuclease McrA